MERGASEKPLNSSNSYAMPPRAGQARTASQGTDFRTARLTSGQLPYPPKDTRTNTSAPGRLCARSPAAAGGAGEEGTTKKGRKAAPSTAGKQNRTQQLSAEPPPPPAAAAGPAAPLSPAAAAPSPARSSPNFFSPFSVFPCPESDAGGR